MNNIILDLNGVVLDNVERHCIKESVKIYGITKTLGLLINYRLGKNPKWISKNVPPIVEKCAYDLKFLDGAAEAMEYFISQENCVLNVCSNVGAVKDAKKLEQHYRNKAPVMNRVQEYSLLKPWAEDKYPFYYNAKYQGFKRVYVVDNDMKNIAAAAAAGVTPVYICKNKRKIQKAAREYGAICFGSLLEFKEHFAQSKSK